MMRSERKVSRCGTQDRGVGWECDSWIAIPISIWLGILSDRIHSLLYSRVRRLSDESDHVMPLTLMPY